MHAGIAPYIVILIAAVAVVVLVAVVVMARREKQKRSERLQRRFGPEYDRAVAEYGSRARAEKILDEREKRSQKITVLPLSVDDREKFAQAWRTVQTRFVDAPGKAVVEADQLLKQLMSQRGYPVGDFEQQAGDLSVDHPRAVGSYRLAHLIADRQRRGEASTEDLREAIIQYRALYDELLEARN